MVYFFESSLWLLVGNGGMDPYDSPLRSLIVVPITHSAFPSKNQSVLQRRGSNLACYRLDLMAVVASATCPGNGLAAVCFPPGFLIPCTAQVAASFALGGMSGTTCLSMASAELSRAELQSAKIVLF